MDVHDHPAPARTTITVCQWVGVHDHPDDVVISEIDYTLTDNVEELRLAGSALNGTGNDLDNTLTGNAGDNRLDGGAGNDLKLLQAA
ncbi:hypothetical protein [Sedimenticola hydrogenitrophicus]|uniref:hypothetical protein n=1 Tax=Sedimenticola hydrogenitrophicus TaxID=2967975 RepID=UPI0021A8D699|nr:hypothetical protein [Sedimenticola hydrogenitrophicus]